jgi:cytochrome oxidase Cu insertion factor (SCO1/SenC/PrrC family)
MNRQDDRRAAARGARRQYGFLTSRQAFVLLGLIFMAPAFVAWVMHHSGGGWRPEGMTNQGNLVQPARPLTMPAGLAAGDKPLNEFLQGKWTLLYIGDADCDAVCIDSLYKMRQIRIAQNENMKRVQTLYLLQGEAVPASLSARLAQDYRDLTVVPVTAAQAAQFAPDFELDGVGMEAAERVYFIDPLGNLMMYYRPDAAPGGMLKDLRKLLKYSRIG